KAEAARDESGGLIYMVSDKEILESYRILADKEGIFVEPASAASVAGILKLNKKGYFKNIKNPKIVCILTGHGLKDPDRAIKSIEKPKVLKIDLNAVLKEIGY
ncbi:MAG: pyridoxal-phosphate dependent enzyme, partial [Candidatus Omnitrophota bacterium]